MATKKPWRERQALWLRCKDMAANCTQIRLPCQCECEGQEVEHELLWCEVHRHLHNLRFLVCLHSSSLSEDRHRKGTYYLAKWDGQTVHGISGRPVLQPERVLRPDEARKYRHPSVRKRG
jgi:hypothetical protein